jgi:hypothetical protein
MLGFYSAMTVNLREFNRSLPNKKAPHKPAGTFVEIQRAICRASQWQH